MSHTSRSRSFKLQSSTNPLLAKQLADISATLISTSEEGGRAARSTAARLRGQGRAGQALLNLFAAPQQEDNKVMGCPQSPPKLIQKLVDYPSSPSVAEDNMIGADEVLATPTPQLRGGEGGLEDIETLMRELLSCSASTEVSHEGEDEKKLTAKHQFDALSEGDADPESVHVQSTLPPPSCLKLTQTQSFPNESDEFDEMKDKYDFVREANEELNALAKRVLEEEAEYHARQLPSILSRRVIVSNIAAGADIEDVAYLFREHENEIYDICMVHRDPLSRTQTAHIDMFTNIAAKFAALTIGSIYGLIPRMRVATDEARV